MSDVGIQLRYIINHANLKFLTLDPNFSQIHSELTFAMTQFASGERLTPKHMCKKNTDNCYHCCMEQLPSSLACSFTAHIKYTKTKCPFQRQQDCGGREPFLPKTKQQCILVVMDTICHSVSSRQMLLSCSLQPHNYSANTGNVCSS